MKKAVKKTTKKPAAKKIEKLTLKDVSKTMQNRIISLMNFTWQVIGYDVLQCMEECGYKPVMPRADVIDCVCDADYMEMHGNDNEAYQVTLKLDYKDLCKLGKQAFPYSRYGY